MTAAAARWWSNYWLRGAMLEFTGSKDPRAGELEAEIAPYRAEKDSLHFRYADPIPYDLITRLSAELARRRRAAD